MTRLFDLDQPIPDEERITAILGLLRTRLAPLVEEAGTRKGLRAMYRDGRLRGVGLMRPALDLLG